MNIYTARYNNAKRIAEKINEYIEKGCIIINEYGEIVTGRFHITEKEISLKYAENFRITYFINDSRLDNGALDSIKKYNVKFSKWKIIDSKNVKQFDI
jgi:hypothetical protein